MDAYEKKYKEAFERAREFVCKNNVEVAEYIFPELSGSEDEKIRKEILSFLRTGNPYSGPNSKRRNKWADWLEKQGEQKELIVLNFRKGDIVEYKSKQWTIIGVDLDNHCYDLSNDECVDFDTAHYAFKLVDQKPATDFSDLRTWKYIVDAVWTEKEGIGQYLDNPFTEEVAKKLQKRFGNIEQKSTDKATSTTFSYITPNQKLFQWIYDRLIYVHNENPNVDYMLSFKERIEDMQNPSNYENATIVQKDFAPIEPRYNIGDVLCDKSCTTLNKDAQPNFEIVDIKDGLYICDKGSIPISQQDEYELVAKKIEQKPIDKVEPKFKVEKDKWYVCISQFCNCIEGRVYKATSDSIIIDDFGTEYDMHSDAYKYFRLWTIQDAKDGDVLADSKRNVILMFRGIGNTSWDDVIDYHCYYNCHKKSFIIQEGVEYWGNTKNNQLKPATKEQRDTLFAKMKEAGYEWSDKDRKLIKIVK